MDLTGYRHRETTEPRFIGIGFVILFRSSVSAVPLAASVKNFHQPCEPWRDQLCPPQRERVDLFACVCPWPAHKLHGKVTTDFTRQRTDDPNSFPICGRDATSCDTGAAARAPACRNGRSLSLLFPKIHFGGWSDGSMLPSGGKLRESRAARLPAGRPR